MKKPRKTRFSINLTDPYVDRINELVSQGLFVDKQEVIRASLRMMFEKYNPIHSQKEEED